MSNVLDLGITQEELREQVIERAADKIAASIEDDYREVKRPLEKKVQQVIDELVTKIADETIAPLVAGQIDAVVLQRTNEWGEKVGGPTTFREYLVARADAFMREPVNYEGKTKEEARDSYGFKATSTRVAHMIHQHLQYNIETAMKSALQTANSSIVNGLQEAVKIKLNEVAASLNVTVKTR